MIIGGLSVFNSGLSSRVGETSRELALETAGEAISGLILTAVDPSAGIDRTNALAEMDFVTGRDGDVTGEGLVAVASSGKDKLLRRERSSPKGLASLIPWLSSTEMENVGNRVGWLHVKLSISVFVDDQSPLK